MSVDCILAYDVNTQTPAGQRRLRMVAKTCEGIGDRVQKSVFEVSCSQAQFVTLIAALERIITDQDSIRIYRVDSDQLDKVQTLGRTVHSQPRGIRAF